MSGILAADVRVGRIYAARRPARTGTVFAPVWNDRQVIYISPGRDQVQFDSPTVKRGRSYPRATMDAFVSWAGADVTDQVPAGGWRPAP